MSNRPQPTSEARADPASFRDPSGRVMHLGGRVFRALTPRGAAQWRLAADACAELVREGLLVDTRELAHPPADLRAAAPDAELFLEHEPVAPITWPAEWTAAMLADAGLLTLDIEQRLLARGLSLQDATAYNVAFRGARPVFLDAGSIVRPARLDIWYALGQFQRMFAYPLMLARRGFTPAVVFGSALDGVTPRRMARALGPLGWLNPGNLLRVYLPAWLEGASRGRAAVGTATSPTGNPEVQRAILRGQARRLRRLRDGLRPRGVWVDYRDDNSYDAQAEQAKQSAVAAFGATLRGARVLDLGANTGTYSRILAANGCRVLALDADHDALDLFYREAAGDRLSGVDFLHANLANPTPGIGYMNRERAPLLQRAHGDGAIALALVHHLLVTAGLTVAQVAELLCGLAPRLLVEYVAPIDPMFQRLVAGREDLWRGLDEDWFRRAFEANGMVTQTRVDLISGRRVLLQFNRVTAAGNGVAA